MIKPTFEEMSRILMNNIISRLSAEQVMNIYKSDISLDEYALLEIDRIFLGERNLQ